MGGAHRGFAEAASESRYAELPRPQQRAKRESTLDTSGGIFGKDAEYAADEGLGVSILNHWQFRLDLRKNRREMILNIHGQAKHLPKSEETLFFACFCTLHPPARCITQIQCLVSAAFARCSCR